MFQKFHLSLLLLFLPITIAPFVSGRHATMKNAPNVSSISNWHPLSITPIETTSDYIVKHVGASTYVPHTEIETYSAKIKSTHHLVPDSAFQDAVVGQEFSLNFSVPPGNYDILLGFVQGNDCKVGARVFHVAINNNRRLDNLDIYRSVGCQKAYIVPVESQVVKPAPFPKISLAFEAVSGKAGLSFVEIRLAKKCSPASLVKSRNDRASHSVPGTYPPYGGVYIDSMKKGYVAVTLDGSGSHSHAKFGGKIARITSYKWTLSNGKVISTSKSFTRNFPIGTTKVRLAVQDQVCTTHEAITAITVTGIIANGADCYFYPNRKTALGGGTLYKDPTPSFSLIQKSLKLKIPTELKNSVVMRCQFLVRLSNGKSTISMDTGGAGVAHIYNRNTKIIDTSAGPYAKGLYTSGGLQAFELLYFRKTYSAKSVLSFKVNNAVPKEVFFDHRRVLPLLKSISPISGLSSGGTVVRLSGYGLNPPVTVQFGNRQILIPQNKGSYNQLSISSPAGSRGTSVQVKIQRSKFIVSKPLTFRYSNTCDDVAFEKKQIVNKDNSRKIFTEPTCITTAADGSLYIGTKTGEIFIIDYDSVTLKIKTKCSSGVFTDPKWKNEYGRPLERTFLGITLDPRDSPPRPYVSVSTLFWLKWGLIKDGLRNGGWANGAVERFKPASSATKSKFPGRCLEHDKTIAENLPVGNSDHALNELLFTSGGDLLVCVGGYTNMGLPALDVGNMWESYFSSAVIILRLSKGSSYNGVVQYTTFSNMRTAKPKSTDSVDIYSTGFRNLFSMRMTREGKILGLDMGPNCKFGDAASSCSEYRESEAAKRNLKSKIDFKGKAILVDRFCTSKHSAGRKDKLLEIKPGKFYGHPNLQRARLRGTPGECAYVDPETDKTAPPLKRSPPSNYEPAIALVKSPKTGFHEYGGNTFCGKLRGTIILANKGVHGTWGIKISENGKPAADPFEILNVKGIRAEENLHGDIILPDIDNGFIFVLRPKTRRKLGLEVINALPFRHGKQGGTLIRIGGSGFSQKSTVFIGSKPCKIKSISSTVIACTVPAANRGGQSVSLEVRSNGESQTLSKAVLYMNV